MIRLLGVFLPLCLAYGTALVWIFDGWMLPDSYYSHGPLLPPLAVALLWLQRRDWAAVATAPDTRGWWLLGPGLLLHAAGAALMIDSLSASSLLLSVPGATWLALGGARLRRLLPILGLLAFAVPMPMFMTGRVAFELKEIAVGAAVGFSGAVGLDVERVNADLFVAPNAVPLEVADACGGLRSLIALVTLGYCFAFFFGEQRGLRRWVLLAAAVPVALFTNVLRITAICWVASRWGVTAASGVAHDVLGYVALAVALGLLIALDAALLRGRGGR